MSAWCDDNAAGRETYGLIAALRDAGAEERDES